jgi:hypothetical protein
MSTQALNFKAAMAVRVALGMMEAVVTPGLNRESHVSNSTFPAKFTQS